ncbi:MAG: hypothetical protein WA740_07185 [Candidatus Binataceae bacterium]
MSRYRTACWPNTALLIACSFAVLTFVQLLQPLGSIALKHYPAAATSHWCSYKHTVKEVGTSGGLGPSSGANGFQKIDFNSAPIRPALGVRRAGLGLSLWQEQSRLYLRKLPPSSTDPGH